MKKYIQPSMLVVMLSSENVCAPTSPAYNTNNSFNEESKVGQSSNRYTLWGQDDEE